MDRRPGKPRRLDNIVHNNGNDVESVPRWAIPRPSLSSTASGGESSISSVKQSKSSQGSSKQRGSNSSQGSNSNHSTHSASSGSMLLNAANLAKVNSTSSRSQSALSNYQSNISTYIQSSGSKSHGSDSITNASIAVDMPREVNDENHSDPFWNHVKLGAGKHPKHDSMSIASSTHFTVVNGFTRHGKKSKSICCKSSHQITVLVVTMTILLTVGIMAAICYVEMRQRRDTGSRFS